MLKEMLDRQVKIAWAQFAITLISFAGSMMKIGVTGKYWVVNSLIYENNATYLTGKYLALVGGVIGFILLIIGIVWAVKINKITRSSTKLIVFSIFILFFAHLIVASLERKKYSNYIEMPDPEKRDVDFEIQLKRTYLDGKITSEEYERQLKEHNNKN